MSRDSPNPPRVDLVDGHRARVAAWAVAGLVTREGDTVGLALVAPTVCGAIALAVTWGVVLVVGVVVTLFRPTDPTVERQVDEK